MTTETSMSAPPVQPADYFDNPASRAAHFAALVKHHETAQPSETIQTVEPNAQDLAMIEATATQGRLADGRPAMLHSGDFRREVEAMRADVLSGKRLDISAAKARVAAALGVAVSPPNVAESAPGAEMSQDQLDVLADRIDAGEALTIAELPEAALSGYTLSLPQGWGIGANEIAMLEAARAADIPQEMVDRYVAALVRSEPAG